MTNPKTDKDSQTIPMHAMGGRFPGWGGINVSQLPRYVSPWEAVDCLNWTNRQGLASDNIGTMSTRPGYADDPDYEMANQDTTTYPLGPLRMLQKFYPDSSIAQGGQVLALVHSVAGANGSIFKSYDGTNWTTKTGNLGNNYFPQSITLGLPSPKFCWTDWENGLHVYDGTDDVAQDIPKYSDGTVNISGAAWLEQVDGRLIVSGNWEDTGESNIVYYSAVNDTTSWTSTLGGGSFPVYAADSTSGNAAPKRITGLAAIHGQLIVFTEDMRYMVSGLGTAYQSVKEYPGSGCFSGKTIVKYDDRLYWWGKDGAFMWDGNRVVRISDKIWNKLNNLKLASGFKWFSFVFEDQWWTCVRYRASASVNGLSTTSTVQTGNEPTKTSTEYYYNFVFDFKDNTWRIYDIPMVAAFNSQGGLDLGGLYFSSPILQGGVYRPHRFGVDDGTGGAVYNDNSVAIVSTWITPQWDGSNETVGMPRMPIYANLWEKYIIALSTAGTGTFSTPVLQYRTDNTVSYTSLAIDTAGISNAPYQHIYFPAPPSAHYVQSKFVVTATKRLDILELYAQYTPLAISRTLG